MSDEENNIKKLLRVLIEPLQDIETALQQLIARTVDNSTGINLDVFGRIVGQPRGGLLDDDYRRLIRARIVANRSSGEIESLLAVAALVLNDDDAYLHIKYVSNATLVLRVEDVIVSADVAGLMMRMLRDAVAAGVRLILEWGESEPSVMFRYDSGPGYDNGHLASALD